MNPSCRSTALPIARFTHSFAGIVNTLLQARLVRIHGIVGPVEPITRYFVPIPVLIHVYLHPDFFNRVKGKGYEQNFLRMLEHCNVKPDVEAEMSSAIKEVRRGRYISRADHEYSGKSGDNDDDEESDLSRSISRRQLDSLYEAAQNEYLAIQGTEPPPTLERCTLRSYQKQALTWMSNRETRHQEQMVTEEGKEISRLHPMYDSFKCLDGHKFYVNFLSRELTDVYPKANPSALGGILADEMGMGKTVETISLILLNRPNPGEGRPHATLVVCPMSLMSQWAEEVAKFSKLRTLLHYGSSRNNGAASSLENGMDRYDVVITSYGTLSSDYKEKNGPFTTKWFRVVLDEAHTIRNFNTLQAKAAFALEAERRWCITGTPIQNDLDDLYAMLKFLREDPWGERVWWNRHIIIPNKSGDPRALPRLQAVLNPLMIRRLKSMKDIHGNPILELPPRVEEILRVDLSPEERAYYDRMYRRTKADFDVYEDTGLLMKNYCSVLTLILRLRQACSHSLLCSVRPKTDEEFKKDVEMVVAKLAYTSVASIDRLVNLEEDLKAARDGELECPICLDAFDAPVVSECGHLFCNDCVNQMWTLNSSSAGCPLCRVTITAAAMTRIELNSDQKVIPSPSSFQHSSKTRVVLDEIKQYSPEEKIVVFSQWTSMLDLVEVPLKKEKITFVRLDGTCSQSNRMKVLSQFSKDDSVRVMLISLKAGGVGLNLVSASRVLMLDCWWNPAVEDQAIQRVHRIGQVRPVVVKRIIMNDTIEERILELQERKKDLANVVSMTSADVKQMRINELRALFGLAAAAVS